MIKIENWIGGIVVKYRWVLAPALFLLALLAASVMQFLTFR